MNQLFQRIKDWYILGPRELFMHEADKAYQLTNYINARQRRNSMEDKRQHEGFLKDMESWGIKNS